MTSCTTINPATETSIQAALDRLLTHPQLNEANLCAPKFTRDALNTVNDLILEINILSNNKQ